MAAPRKVDPDELAAYVRAHPAASYLAVATHFHIAEATAVRLALATGARQRQREPTRALINRDVPLTWETGTRALVAEAARRFPVVWFSDWADRWLRGEALPWEAADIRQRCRSLALAALDVGDMTLAAVASLAEVAAMDASGETV